MSQTTRAIPWECSDWQAFAHADRTTSILESLAENRGKTLYCRIDQSDTFAKAATWEAGKDRNERDDNVYYGERGIFRGFIAAQEGWLTEGESGVTGVSIDRIFEFPREERRRTKRVKRLPIASEGDCPDTDPRQRGSYTPGTLACSEWGGYEGYTYGGDAAAFRDGKYQNVLRIRQDTVPRGRTDNWSIAWQTFPSAAYWQDLAETAAKNTCRVEGYPQVTNVAFHAGHNGNNGAPGSGIYREWLGLAALGK